MGHFHFDTWWTINMYSPHFNTSHSLHTPTHPHNLIHTPTHLYTTPPTYIPTNPHITHPHTNTPHTSIHPTHPHTHTPTHPLTSHTHTPYIALQAELNQTFTAELEFPPMVDEMYILLPIQDDQRRMEETEVLMFSLRSWGSTAASWSASWTMMVSPARYVISNAITHTST